AIRAVIGKVATIYHGHFPAIFSQVISGCEPDNAATYHEDSSFGGWSGWIIRAHALNNLKTMCIRVIVVDNDRIVARYHGPAFDPRNDGRLPIAEGVGYFFFDRADKFRADNAFMYEPVTRFELAFRMPLGHPRRCAGTAGRPVDSLVTIKYRIPSCGRGVECFSGPLDMAQPVDVFIFRVYERVLVVESIPQYPAPTNQLLG